MLTRLRHLHSTGLVAPYHIHYVTRANEGAVAISNEMKYVYEYMIYQTHMITAFTPLQESNFHNENDNNHGSRTTMKC